MDSKILAELTELRDNVSKIKYIFKTDFATTGQKILDKVDLKEYKFTEDENKVKQEIEEIMEFISYIVNEFYIYNDEDLDKLIIK